MIISSNKKKGGNTTSFELEDFDDYLAHHGIKGQKWGIRRYQNPDGSLTEAGKKHYGRQVKKAKNKADAKYHFMRSMGQFNAYGKRHTYRDRALKEIAKSDPEYLELLKKSNKENDEIYRYEQELNKKYPDGKWPREDIQRVNSMYEEHDKSIEALGNRYWDKIIPEHAPEILSAGLKDIGMNDTEYNRQMLKELAASKNSVTWIYFM